MTAYLNNGNPYTWKNIEINSLPDTKDSRIDIN